MAKEIVRRAAPTNTEIEQIVSNYEPSRIAGVWAMRPIRPPEQAFPFLALSMSRAHVPLKSMPLFRYDAGITSERSIFPVPQIETTDNYGELAEMGLVQIVGLRKKQAQVWIPRRVSPLVIHPPIMEALGVFMDETKVDWQPDSLQETDINKDFMTLKSPVPRQTIAMELGGPPRQLQADALIAAGLRLAVAETIVIQDFRDYQAAHPEKFRPLED